MAKKCFCLTNLSAYVLLFELHHKIKHAAMQLFQNDFVHKARSIKIWFTDSGVEELNWFINALMSEFWKGAKPCMIQDHVERRVKLLEMTNTLLMPMVLIVDQLNNFSTNDLSCYRHSFYSSICFLLTNLYLFLFHLSNLTRFFKFWKSNLWAITFYFPVPQVRIQIHVNCKLCYSQQPNLKPTLCRSTCGKWVSENWFHYPNERNYKVKLSRVVAKFLIVKAPSEVCAFIYNLCFLTFISLVHVLCSCSKSLRLTACCGLLHKDKAAH